MKKITTKVLTIVAACAAMVFASCAAPSTVNGGDDKNNGNGGTDIEPTSNYAKYTMNATEEADAGEVGYLLQIDNDGEQSASGLSIQVDDLKIAIKVGSANWETKDLGTVTMIPDQYASPEYSKTSCRTVIPGVSIPAGGAAIQVKVVSATVDNKEKEASIICALQREGGDYQFFGIPDAENWKSAFAAAN